MCLPKSNAARMNGADVRLLKGDGDNVREGGGKGELKEKKKKKKIFFFF